MLLILIRHAKAFERDSAAWPDDLRRPLTAEGREEFQGLAKGLGRFLPEVELLLASPATRAWQTARILHERSGWPEPQRDDALLPAAARDEVDLMANLVRSQAGRSGVALVGHEPALGRFASWLLSGDPGTVRLEFRKGAAVGLELPSDRTAHPAGSAVLRWMVTPRFATRLKGRK